MKPLRAWVPVGFVAVLAAVAVAQPLGGFGRPDLLDPQDAFRLRVVEFDAKRALIEFRIAEGYYLYRDRFRFETPDGRVIAEAELPRGKAKQDPFFGRTEIYRDRVTIRVPLSGRNPGRGSIRLKIVSQGCSDSGVCYIPQEQWVDVALGTSRKSLPR